MVSNKTKEVRTSLFYRGYETGEAIDLAEQIINNLNDYVLSLDRTEHIRKQREQEREAIILHKQMMSKPCISAPDKWFTTLPGGKIKASLRNKLVNDAIEARDACFGCPAMIACGEMGMDEENLYHGIWGGMLVAERLEKAGMTRATAQSITEKAEWRMKELVDAAIRLQM